MSTSERTCPWPDCGRAIRREHFLCRTHWGQLPLEHRIAVNAAWRQNDGLRLIDAQDKAVAWAREHVRSRSACPRKRCDPGSHL